MSANSFGEKFILHSFGESHGPAIGAVLDGCPAGVPFDLALLVDDLKRRRPGNHLPAQSAIHPIGESNSHLVSQRKEADEPVLLSGVYAEKTLGTPIAIMVQNTDARSTDYSSNPQAARAGHADDVWKQKFGHSDHRGGGRSSGRETVARVIGGSIAKMYLKAAHPGVSFLGFADQIGEFALSAEDEKEFLESHLRVDNFAARFPSKKSSLVSEYLQSLKSDGDSCGGSVKILIRGLPAGLGQPVFHKLKSDLAAAMMSVGATTGFEFGEGFRSITQKGTIFHVAEDKNQKNYGGIRGGITTGEDVYFRVAFKPTSSILDVAKKGRHDPCIVIRAIPVLEAMAALVIADHSLMAKSDRL